MKLPNYFKDFLQRIRPDNRQAYIDAHTELRELLENDEQIKTFYVDSFLQGSYRRATALKPEDDKHGDVDVVVATTLDHNNLTPRQALNKFTPFLNKHYKDRWTPQARAIKIEFDDVDLDMVITALPKGEKEEEERKAYRSKFVESYATPGDEDDSWLEFRKLAEDANSWKLHPIKIPDREIKEWEDTHPLAQLIFTWDKSAQTNRHYVNVVKAIKWWKRINHPKPKYPRAYPLEHLIGIHCPNQIDSVAAGVTLFLESIAKSYAVELSEKRVPFLPDHGVPAHNVFARLSFDDFEKFHERACEAAKIARQALESTDPDESVQLWKKLFGEEFDSSDGDEEDESKGYSKRKGQTNISTATYG